MRRSLLLQALLTAVVPIVAATAQAALKVPLPNPTPPPVPTNLTPIQMPLTVAPIVGTQQTFSSADGGSLVPSCDGWAPANCAAPVNSPTLGSNGTGGTCSDAAFLYCCPTQAATCTPLLTTLYDNTYQANVADAGATLPVPASMPSGNTSVTGIGYAAAPVLAAQTGTGSTIIGTEVQRFTKSPYVPTSPGSMAQMLLTAQTAYTNTWSSPRYTGQTISSCDEYVWKKWAGYAQWEDAARAGANDPIWVARGTFAAFNAPPTRSDGTPFSDNGTPFTYQYTTGQTMPRNAFLSFVPTWLSTTDPTQAAILTELQAEQATPFVLGAAGSMIYPAFDTNDLTLASTCTDSIDPKCSTLGGSWGVWCQTGQPCSYTPASDPSLFPTLPQQISEMESDSAQQARLDNYASLLGQLADLRIQMVVLEREMTAYVASSGHTTQSTVPIVYPAVSAPLLDGAPAPSTGTPTPSFSSYYFPHSSARRAAAVSYLTQAMKLTVTQWPSGTTPTPVTPTGNITLTSFQNQLNAAAAQVAVVQEQITQALVGEWNAPNRGCLLGLVPGSDGWYPQSLNSCDWSPTAFIQNYMGLYVPQRQAAYNRCIADTGDVFPPPSGASSVFANPIWKTTNWTATLSEFESYLGDYENRDALNAAYAADLSATEKSYLSATTSIPVIGNGCAGVNQGGNTASGCSQTFGESAGDTHTIGGQYFGANVSYGGGWWVQTALEPASAAPAGELLINSLTADVNTSLHGGVTVFGAGVTIIDAALDVESKPGDVVVNKAHLTILGDDLYAGPEGQSFASPYSLASGSIQDTPFSPSFSVIIPILCIPVKISAGIAVTIGASVSATVTSPPATSALSTESLTFSANATPFAKVTADAQAGVDLLVISAGIQANLTLIDASLSTTGSLGLVEQSGELALQTNVTSNLNLNELSGNVELYAEADLLFWSDEATISLGSWPGFHQEIPLVNRTSTWPIDAIAYRLDGQVNPNDVP